VKFFFKSLINRYEALPTEWCVRFGLKRYMGFRRDQIYKTCNDKCMSRRNLYINGCEICTHSDGVKYSERFLQTFYLFKQMSMDSTFLEKYVFKPKRKWKDLQCYNMWCIFMGRKDLVCVGG